MNPRSKRRAGEARLLCAGLPPGCTPLVLDQPLMGREHDDAVNPENMTQPVAWVKR